MLYGTGWVFRESVSVLVDSTPKDLQFEDVQHYILNFAPEIEGIHDVHIWTIGGGERALMAHLVMSEGVVSSFHPLLAKLDYGLKEQFEITHTTFELGCEKCKSKENICL